MTFSPIPETLEAAKSEILMWREKHRRAVVHHRKQDEAIKLALEALERTKELMVIKGGGMYEQVRAAIKLLREVQG